MEGQDRWEGGGLRVANSRAGRAASCKRRSREPSNLRRVSTVDHSGTKETHRHRLDAIDYPLVLSPAGELSGYAI